MNEWKQASVRGKVHIFTWINYLECYKSIFYCNFFQFLKQFYLDFVHDWMVIIYIKICTHSCLDFLN